MALARRSSVRIDKAKLERLIERALESPRAKATLARVANDESRKMVVIAEQIAREELHERPDDRRTEMSRAHGKHYHESFEIVPADTSDPRKVMAGITNTHPARFIIENGSKGHTIRGTGGKKLRFPGNEDGSYTVDESLRGGIRTKDFWGANPRRREGTIGAWPLTGPPWAFRDEVEHPGTTPKNILARTTDRYRKSTRANVKSRSTR